MGWGRVGRIYVPDPHGGGVYYLEGTELCHAPLLPDGRVSWENATAVDFWAIEEHYVREAREAGLKLCKRAGYSPEATREVLHGS